MTDKFRVDNSLDEAMTAQIAATSRPDLASLQRWLRLPKIVGYRLFRWAGELTSIILGLAIIWFFGLNTLLSRQTVDISGLKPNAQLWFSQAFNGSDAQIENMQLSWRPATNTIVFDATDVVIRDKDGKEIETVPRLQTEIPLREAAGGRFIPRRLIVEGGAVTWLRGNNGAVIAGLGTPDTVGRLGPIWRGNKNGTAASSVGFHHVESVIVTNATAYVIDDADGLELTFEDTDIEFQNRGDAIEVQMASYLRKDAASIPLKFSMTASPDLKSYAVNLSAVGLNLAKLSPRRGRYAQLRAIDSVLDLKAAFKVGAETGLETADIDLKAGEGRFGTGENSTPFKAARYKANLMTDSQVMDIEDIVFTSEALSFAGTGTVNNLGRLTDGDINTSPVFDLSFDDIKIDQTPRFQAPITLAGLSTKGSLDLDSRRVDLENLFVDFGHFQIESKAFFNWNENGGFDHIQVSGNSIGRLNPKDILAVWPIKFADGARRWIDRSVLAGDIHNMVFEGDFGPEIMGGDIPQDEDVLLTFDVDNGRVKYISTMTPYTEVSGKGTLRGNSITMDVMGGRVGDVMIMTGRTEIPRLQPKGGDIIINISGKGRAADMMGLIDQKPFEFASKYGVKPKDFGGTGKVDISITRPLLVYFDQNRIEYSVTGTFEEASAPFSLRQHKVEQGFVTLTADKTAMTIKGPVNIGPWQADLNWKETFDSGATPTRYQVTGRMMRDTLDKFGLGFREYFDGEIGLNIDATGTGLDLASADITADLTDTFMRVGDYWSKANGARSQLKTSLRRLPSGSIRLDDIDLTAPGFDLAGHVELAENFRLLDLDLKRANITGFIDAAVKAKPDERNEKLSVFVTGRYLDVSPLVTGAIRTRTGNTIDVPILLTAGLDKLALNEAYILQNANILLSHNGQGVTSARIGGDTKEGEFIVDLTTNETTTMREMRVDIPDASEAIFAFLKLDNITGGRMQLNAQLPGVGTKGPLNGTAEVADFTLIEAPIMTQLLSLGSLTGLMNTLGGEGLKFDDFIVPFSLSDEVLKIQDARISGPALGMTGDGEILLADRKLDFDGVLVPAYTANSLLGDIPVLGDLIVGKKGEGIFALNYTVKGSFDTTQIAVNPLSALTPGFLRGIFKPKREKLPDAVMAEIEAVRPE